MQSSAPNLVLMSFTLLLATINPNCNGGNVTYNSITAQFNCTRLTNVSVICEDVDVNVLDFRDYANIRRLVIRNSSVQELSFLQSKIFAELRELDLSQNSIENLEHDAFSDVPNVTNLNLSRNALAYIYPSCLTHLSALAVLDLTHNKLLGPSAGAFQALPALAKLYLSHNYKLGVGLNAIVAISRRLTELRMNAAGLHHVPEILTRSVMLLDLAGNQLQEILDGDFDSYPYLRQLDLSNNQISYIQDDALGRIEALQELNLSMNHLIEIPSILPSDLRFLNISTNFISTINSLELLILTRLETLDLSYNELRSMPSLTLPQLKILRIEGNGLLTLGDNFLLNFPRLIHLHAAGNNLTCEEANWLAIKVLLTGVNLRKGCWNLTTIEVTTFEPQESTSPIQIPMKHVNIVPKKKPVDENTSSLFKKPIVYNISNIYKLKIFRTAASSTTNISYFHNRNLNNSEIIRIRPTVPAIRKGNTDSYNTTKPYQTIKVFRVNKPRRQIPINSTDRISNLTKPVPQKRVAESKGRPVVKTSALVEHPPEKGFAGHPGLLAVLGTVVFLIVTITIIKLFRDRKPTMSDKRYKCQNDLLQMDLLKRNDHEIDLW